MIGRSALELAGRTAYAGPTGAVTLTEGSWIVTRHQLCAFMALAGSAGPA